jgi:hypothetical protein
MACGPSRARRLAAVMGLGIILSLLPQVVSADGPRYSSDGLYVGGRVSPGVALFVAYDLDVYFDTTRRYSLGPGIGATFFGAETEPGQQQDYTIEVDPLRFKVQPGIGGQVRPYGLIAGGFLYGRFPSSPSSPTSSEELAATLTIGAGADFWIEENWALGALLQTRLRLSDSNRLPVVWVELAIGARFGM